MNKRVVFRIRPARIHFQPNRSFMCHTVAMEPMIKGKFVIYRIGMSEVPRRAQRPEIFFLSEPTMYANTTFAFQPNDAKKITRPKGDKVVWFGGNPVRQYPFTGNDLTVNDVKFCIMHMNVHNDPGSGLGMSEEIEVHADVYAYDPQEEEDESFALTKSAARQ